MKPVEAIPMTNHHFDSKSPWIHVSVERKLPAMMNIALGAGTAMELIHMDTDEQYGLLKAAIRAKVFLLAENLKTITASLKLDVPKFPNGSGSKGSVIKEDHARALVRFLFEGETEEVQEGLVRGLAPPTKPKKKNPDENMDEMSTVLGMISMLDPENAQAFDKMSQLAKDGLAEMYKQEGAEEVKARVRDALEKEDIEIDFESKGKVKVKRKQEPNTGDKRESAEINATWVALIGSN